MSNIKSDIKMFSKLFDDTFALGFNPACASMTVCDFPNEDYQKYVNSRLRAIRRGEDLKYRLKKIVRYKLIKINK